MTDVADAAFTGCMDHGLMCVCVSLFLLNFAFCSCNRLCICVCVYLFVCFIESACQPKVSELMNRPMAVAVR